MAGIQLHGRLGVGDALAVLPGTQERRDEIHPVHQRVQFAGATLQRDCLIVAFERRTETSVEIMGVGVARAQFQRPREALLSTWPVEPVRRFQVPHRAMRDAQKGIEPQRPRRRFPRPAICKVGRHGTMLS